MRIQSPFQALGAALIIAMLVACSGDPAIAPKPLSPQGGRWLQLGERLGFFNPVSLAAEQHQHFKSFYACPPTGPIEYASDEGNSVINIYAGRFAGQAPCGQLTSGLQYPDLMTVDKYTHDLYVANTYDFNILAFHRGQTSPYNIYSDPGVQVPTDVAVLGDSTLIAINSFQANGPESGSISTWRIQSNGGKFVGNFPIENAEQGSAIAISKSGIAYFTTINPNGIAELWYVSCPAGACGGQLQFTNPITWYYPGGLAFNASNDLLAANPTHQVVDTFELPNPRPSTFPGSGYGIDIDGRGTHLYVAFEGAADEYSYPSGTLIGSVPGNVGGLMLGMAVDP